MDLCLMLCGYKISLKLIIQGFTFKRILIANIKCKVDKLRHKAETDV